MKTVYLLTIITIIELILCKSLYSSILWFGYGIYKLESDNLKNKPQSDI